MLLFSRQGKLRLQKWYVAHPDKLKKKITRELITTVLARKPKMCSFLEWKDVKIVYKRLVSENYSLPFYMLNKDIHTVSLCHTPWHPWVPQLKLTIHEKFTMNLNIIVSLAEFVCVNTKSTRTHYILLFTCWSKPVCCVFTNKELQFNYWFDIITYSLFLLFCTHTKAISIKVVH